MRGKKKCPDCDTMVGNRTQICKKCGYAFQKKGPIPPNEIDEWTKPEHKENNFLQNLKNLSPEEIEQLRKILGPGPVQEKSEEKVDKDISDSIITRRVSDQKSEITAESKQTRTQPANYGYENKKRPNLFFKHGFDKMCRKDIKTDKLLAGSNMLEQRGTRQSIIKMKCCACNKTVEIPISMICDKNGNVTDSQFTCDSCQRLRHG